MVDQRWWCEIARRVSEVDGPVVSTTRRHAQIAVEEMLGEDVTRLLGQVMLDLDPGWELAASTASLLRPRAIMRECIERYGRGTEPDVRLRAVMLLGSCGDETAVPFLSALIEDEEVVARAASAALRKLVMDGYAEPDVLRPILVTMARTWSASPEAEAEREQAAQLLREMSE